MSQAEQQIEPSPARPRKYRLSPAEEEIMRLLVEGAPNKIIAHAVGLNQKAVDAMLFSLYQRSGTDGNRVRLAVWAVKQGLV